MKYFISIVLFLNGGYYAIAQKGVSFALSFEKAIGELSFTHKSTLGYTLSYESISDKQILSFGIGYQSFDVRQDTFYYFTAEKEYGYNIFSKLTVIPLYAGLYFTKEIIDKLDVMIGMNIGYYLVFIESENQTFNTAGSGKIEEGFGDLSPKLGLKYAVTDHIHLALETKYNLFFALGSNQINTIYSNTNYNSSFGSYYTTYSNSLSFIYLF